MIVYGIGDASFKAGEKAVGGQMILLGNKNNDKVVPILWKTKLIKQVCHSAKDGETRNIVRVVDLSCFAANQISELIHGKVKLNKFNIENKIPVKIFTDSLSTLESIASTHQVERRLMRSSIADLKQKLEDKDVQSYCWMEDSDMVADILTKEMKDKWGLNEVMHENRLRCIKKEENIVTEEAGEFLIRNRTVKAKKFDQKVKKHFNQKKNAGE